MNRNEKIYSGILVGFAALFGLAACTTSSPAKILLCVLGALGCLFLSLCTRPSRG
jgi:hypothetical protein